MTRSKPKKVLFVLPALTAGGAERVLITLMNNIDRSRFKPEFIAMQEEGPLKDLIEKDVTIHSIGHQKSFYGSILPLLRKVREIKPDITVSTMAHTNFATLIIRPFLGKKTRTIVREAITPSYMFKTMKKGWLIKFLYKFLYPRANMVISPAQRIIDEFNELLGSKASNHKLLYNPVNRDLIRSADKIAETPDEQRNKTVHFVCAGRLNYQKGFDQLINALPNFNCDYNWKITILGDGDERDNLTKLIEQNKLQDKVILHGFTDAPWPYIGAADCFLLPSRFEGLPNVVLESLCVGTPVISTSSAGGIQEIYNVSEKNTVTIVDDMTAFIQAMKNAKPNPTMTYRSSLLPQTFQTEHVVNRFMDMLESDKSESMEAHKKAA